MTIPIEKSNLHLKEPTNISRNSRIIELMLLKMMMKKRTLLKYMTIIFLSMFQVYFMLRKILEKNKMTQKEREYICLRGYIQMVCIP